MIQTLIVILLVTVAVFFAVRRLVRTLRNKDKGCCGSCEGCPLKGGGECHCVPRLPDIEL